MILADQRRTIAAIVIAAAAVAATMLSGSPLFATNDDAGLALVGAGLGMAAEPEPHLVFSHYGYGLLLNGLSRLVGASAYGFATMLGVGFSLGLFIYAVGRRWDALIAALCVVGGTIYTTAFLQPQFTVTAGMLAAAAAAGYIASAHRREDSCGILLLLYAAGVLGFLIRPASALAVMVVCAPALIWIVVREAPVGKGKGRNIAFVLTVTGLLLYASDWAAYHFSEGWRNVLEYNLVRALFNDFFQVPWVAEAPAYRAAGWSENDYRMFMSWFANHDIYSFDRISSIASEVGSSRLTVSPASVARWYSRLFLNPQTAAMLLCQGVLLIAFKKSRPIVLLLFLGLIGAVFISALTGRPPYVRVLVTIAGTSLMCSVAAAFGRDLPGENIRWRRMFLVLLAMVGLSIGARAVLLHRTAAAAAADYRKGLQAAAPIFSGKVVAWGPSLVWEWLVTPTGIFPPIAGRTIPSIGALSRTPVLTTALHRVGISDLGQALCLDHDIHIIAPSRYIERLETFCEEHYRTRPGYRLVYAQGSRTKIFARKATGSP
jgi:hypothetical protein